MTEIEFDDFKKKIQALDNEQFLDVFDSGKLLDEDTMIAREYNLKSNFLQVELTKRLYEGSNLPDDKLYEVKKKTDPPKKYLIIGHGRLVGEAPMVLHYVSEPSYRKDIETYIQTGLLPISETDDLVSNKPFRRIYCFEVAEAYHRVYTDTRIYPS